MAYSVTFPRTRDAVLGWLGEVTLTAPEGWTPPTYHVATCPDCGQVIEAYSPADPRIVHRATGWAMCAPPAR